MQAGRDNEAGGVNARHLLSRPSGEQLKLAIERSSFENLRKQESKKGFKENLDKAERFFREGKAGQWQEGLTRGQVRRIAQEHHVQMARFEYLTDELKHCPVSLCHVESAARPRYQHRRPRPGA